MPCEGQAPVRGCTCRQGLLAKETARQLLQPMGQGPATGRAGELVQPARLAEKASGPPRGSWAGSREAYAGRGKTSQLPVTFFKKIQIHTHMF